MSNIEPNAIAVAAVQQHAIDERTAEPLLDGAVAAAAANPYENRSDRASFWQRVAHAVSGS